MDQASWREKLERFKIPLGLSLVGLVLIAGGVFTSGLNQSTPKQLPPGSLIDSPKVLAVDVSGAVVKPGVYKLKEGSRIEDAITAAGGFTPAANQEYISKYLNMAQKLSDGSKVYVPTEGEQTTPVSAGIVAGATSSQVRININTASQSDLEALFGIGPATASKIISARPFQTVEELLSKKILSKPVFEKVKEQLVVY